MFRRIRVSFPPSANGYDYMIESIRTLGSNVSFFYVSFNITSTKHGKALIQILSSFFQLLG